MDDRDHFFVAGLTFWPPANAFQAKFLENGHDPVHFSIAKPDLVEIRRDSKGMTLWQVVDAKSCLKVKVGHTLCQPVLFFIDSPRPRITFKFISITFASRIC